jgi:endonuclease/exonuclease/phosphatase family metal-dependent hydrolase
MINRTVLRIVTWNIGSTSSDSANLAAAALDEVVHRLSILRPTILALQEVPSSQTSFFRLQQAAEQLGLKHFVRSESSEVIGDDAGLRLATFSCLPISQHRVHVLPNPRLRARGPDGKLWHSHSKGFIAIRIWLDGVGFRLLNLHLLPFRHFAVDPWDPRMSHIWRDLDENLAASISEPFVACGDFNLDLSSALPVLPYLSNLASLRSLIHECTRPYGSVHDNILCSVSLDVHSSSVHLTGLDHYACVADIGLGR